jgi:glucan phosphoethanolaminetransferase (alkaline phosphatase superfamily)
MSTVKIITSINWVFISIYGAFVLWALLQKANPYNDAGGGDMEIALKGLAVFLLLALIGLNWLPYQWTKVVALLLVLSLLLLVRYISTH